jgi:catechol 2,3-dioxygenase-like lactoylglutathione lyase family enzyme
MNFVSIRLITADIKRLVSFYERITGLPPIWYTEDFAELSTPTSTLAIGSTRTMQLFGTAMLTSTRGGSAIIEFLVPDVDATYEKVKAIVTDVVQTPTTMPWGNRSLLFRDPDGTLVNCFTPVTPQAIAKFQRQGQ